MDNLNTASAPDDEAQKLRAAQREELRQECIAASEHFKRTGLHLTNEEVCTWLRKLETGEYVDPPACHT
jgi:predicted transcriptional regulator